ncbi:hypothetical protein [Gemella haemolysans]|jgi:hypothetical protein|uniref:Uncharacterized protein n=2 Tax=Gemella haemolysans TaxID=1379 RepID=A0AA87BA73_9BACL|nr:hypothetical protein [Gemella haemolysans]EGF87497.1 hypothetical protein HMPREF0428_00372 [Gemella haemolysans M341]QIX87784.1 hypothetical protein FOC48_02990 [Gemella haemolysans]
MGKKLLLGLVGAGALAATVFHKKENLSSEERAKVEEAKKYLEEKGYVVTGKSKFPVGGLNILSVSSLPMYYKAVKTVAKFIL